MGGDYGMGRKERKGNESKLTLVFEELPCRYIYYILYIFNFMYICIFKLFIVWLPAIL